MATIKSASEAFKDSNAQLADAQKVAISKAIDVACTKGLFSCFCKMSPEVATYLRGLGYSVDEQTNFGKIQGYEISWSNNEGESDDEDKEPEEPKGEPDEVEVTLTNTEVISDENGDVVIDTIE